MKTLFALLALLVSLSGFAATRAQINASAQRLLLSNLPQLDIESGEAMPKDAMVNHLRKSGTSLSTQCTFIVGDELYSCVTTATNAKDDLTLFFSYQLEGEKNKRPTGFLFLSVYVNVAG